MERETYTDSRKRLSDILNITRCQSGKSQEYMANELGVARKTVQNWEKGVTCPTFDQAIDWFKAINISPLPYLFQYIFPELEGINSKDEDKRLRTALILLVQNMPMEGVRQLLYLVYGDHGSSSRAVLNLVTAHLQTPMKDRVTHANVIVNNYDIAKKKNNLTSASHVQPDIEFLKSAIAEGEKAVLNDSEVYMVDRRFK